MANHVSALKRARQSLKRRLRNRAVTSTVRTAIKKVSADIIEKEAGSLESTLKTATATLARAASKGVIPKRRASRKISKLTLKANRILLDAAATTTSEATETPAAPEAEAPETPETASSSDKSE